MSSRFASAAIAGAAVLCTVLACGGNPPPTYDVPPVLANRDEITEAMRAIGAGLEARVVLQVRVDSEGYVREARVLKSSGEDELDNAAVWIGEQMRFRPAQHEGRAVAALVRVPVVFDVVTNVVRPPRLRNAETVEAIIAREHPDTQGSARFRIQVGPEGWIRQIRDRRPSDPAVLPIARKLIEEHLRFQPAFKEGREIAAWVDLTVEFAGTLSRIYVDSAEI